MDAKTREKIFEPFFTTKEQGRGTGLGLAIVYGVVKQNEGFVNVYSDIGMGTTFRIYLPLIDVVPEEIPSREQPEIVGGSETVLVAEDDDTVRGLMKTILEERGYVVITAKDGGEAVETFRKRMEDIDLLILDVIMPKKTGKEVFDEITGMKSGIKALFSSGYADDIIQRRGFSDMRIHFISKPVSPTELLAKVREALDT